MSDYTHKSLPDVEDMAPQFGMPAEMQARFAGRPMGLERTGLTYFRLAPGFRIPFGHSHANQEEVYVVVRGSARVKVDDEIVELGEWDAIRFDKGTTRNMEGGPEGCEYLAFGAGDDPTDAEMTPGWWTE